MPFLALGRLPPSVTLRLTFFVNKAAPTSDGWVVEGDSGLGPPAPGDRFTFVHHQDDGRDETVDLTVAEVGAASLRLTGATDVGLRSGDILGGERDG